ncbi:MAG: hypothetical protein HQM08_03745 [Candidatus Riflebacteria bacterium]|nr:hypothetical protein [Candidatus Riflebacteria bacterium]
MFFKHILIGFIILGIFGYFYGDRVFKFQAEMMINWQYDFPAYEAYERIIQYYPSSPFREEALKMMEVLTKRNGDLKRYLDMRDKDVKATAKKRAQAETFR